MSWVADHDVDDEEEDVVGNITTYSSMNCLFVLSAWGGPLVKCQGHLPLLPDSQFFADLPLISGNQRQVVVLVKGGTVHMNPLFCSNSISLIYQL